jgi:hypothetical protein
MRDINCKFLGSWGLAGRTKTAKKLPLSKNLFSRTIYLYIEYVLEMHNNFLLLLHCDESV